MTTNDNLKGLEAADGEWYLIGFKDNCVVGIDGGHSDIEGVAQALKLHIRIFGGDKRYEGVEWRAAFLVAVPEIDVPINDEAADFCRMVVDKYRGRMV